MADSSLFCWVYELRGLGFLLMGWVVLFALLVATVPVAAGEGGGLREVRAAAFGFDAADATRALQSAIDSGAARVVVENTGKPWVIGETIHLRGDQEIVFGEGVEVVAKAGAFRRKSDVLFGADGKRNIALSGRGAVLRMRKADYQGDAYERSEWRHALQLRACTNVTVMGLTLAESGGDGIYLGAGKGGEPCLGVTIRDVVCLDNHRQGISVISAEDLLIEGCALKGTRGTPPQAGIDFEPNRPNERLVNVVMRRCVTEGNAGGAYLFALHQLRGTSAPISIRLEGCAARGDERGAVRFHVVNAEDSGALKGKCEFVDCRFGTAAPPLVSISGNAPGGVAIRFERCALDATGLKDAARLPVEFVVRAGDVGPIGGVTFLDCVVEETMDRAPIGYAGGGFGWGIEGVAGNLSVKRGGARTDHVLDAATLAKWIPAARFRRFARTAHGPGDMRPLVSGEFRAGPGKPARVRGKVSYLLWAEKGDEVVIAGKVLPVGRGEAGTLELALTAPSGKAMKGLEISAGGSPESRFVAPETGAYQLACARMQGGSTLEFDSPSHRLCIFTSGEPIGLFRSLVPLYFSVPVGTSAFGIRVAGAGGAEKVGIEVVDPTGRVVASRDALADMEQFVFEGDGGVRAGTWEARFKKPADGVFEDFSLVAEGIPSVFAWRKDALLGPGAGADR